MTDTFVRSTLAEIEALLVDRVTAVAAALGEAHAEAARAAAEAHASALEEQEAAAAAREQALRAAHDAALAEARSETGGEVARLVAERAAELDSARAEYDLAVSALRDDLAQLTASIADARALHAAELDAEASAHRDETERLSAAHRVELADLRAAHQAELEALRETIRTAGERRLAVGATDATEQEDGRDGARPAAWDEIDLAEARSLSWVDEGHVLEGAARSPSVETGPEGADAPGPGAPTRPLTIVGADWFREHDAPGEDGRDGARSLNWVSEGRDAAPPPTAEDDVHVVEGADWSVPVEAIVDGAAPAAPAEGGLEAVPEFEPAVAELDRPRPKSLERMRDALAQLDGAASLKDTLDRLADVLAEHSPRSMVFIVRGDWLRGWRFNGFGEHAPAADSVVLAIEHTGEFRPVIEEGARADVHPARFGGAMHSLAFAHLDGDATGVAVPVRLTGKSVAVLYVDEGEPGGTATGGAAEAVEILARHASRCLEAITATRSAAALGARANGPGSNQPGPAARRDAAGEPAAVEVAAGLAVVPAPPVAPPSPEVLAAAERFAALVVSEIKLYNDAAIHMGRKKRDLRTRLHAEIDRASGLFQERMGTVPGHEVIFERELVRVLAGGDAELLGKPHADAV